jgi:hypothetical protein
VTRACPKRNSCVPVFAAIFDLLSKPPLLRVRSLQGAAPLARAALVLLLLLPGLPSVAQDVTEPALKAAFIYNFALFTTWPADALPTGPSVLCVLGDSAVAQALEQTVEGRLLAGRPMTVSRLAATESPRRCAVLYLSHVSASDVAQILSGLGDAPVLTISDMDGFGQRGGIAQFYFDHGRLRFSVDVPHAKHAHLEISSRLLSLSKQP